MFDRTINTRFYVSNLWKRLQGRGVGAVLARGASSSFAVMTLGAAMAFVANVLLARLMGITQYGIYIYALTWINVLALACKLGMDTSLLRFIAAYNAKEEWGLLRGILQRSVWYVLLASLLFAVIAALVVWLLYENIGAEQATTFWVAFLLLPILALTGLRSASLRALKHIVQASLPDGFIRPLLLIIFVSGVFLFSQQHLHASQVMLINLLGAIMAFFVGTIWLIKALPKQLRYTPPVYAASEWLKVSIPLFLISGMYLILNKTDIIMLGAILNTEQAGIYAVVSRVAGLVVFGLVAVNAIVAPMISELYATNRRKELQRMITLAAWGIFTFTIVVSICLAGLGEFVLGLFGKEFAVGYVSLLILLAGQLVNALSGSVGFLMTMTGHQKQAAWIIGTSALINIILNAVLIPRFGLEGAAVSTAITTALWNILMLFYVWHRLDINPTILAKG